MSDFFVFELLWVVECSMCYDVIKSTYRNKHLYVNINQLEILRLTRKMRIVTMPLLAGPEA
jgi:hypothetical protein